MEATVKSKRRALKSHFDAVVHFFTVMDAEMISDLLDENRTYQDFPKHVFARKLGDVFHDLQRLGDTKLLAMVDDDPLPNDGSFGVTFEGDATSLFMEVVFDVDEIGFITDIYEISDTQEEISSFSKKQRVFIDQFMDTDMANSFGDDMFDEDDMEEPPF